MAGAVWEEHWRNDYQAAVITPRHYDRDHDRLPLREQCSRRQVIETVNGALVDGLHLSYPRARTMAGLVCRVAAKLAAGNCAIWLNRLLGRPDLAIATLFPG